MSIIQRSSTLQLATVDLCMYSTIYMSRRPYNLYCVGGDVKPCSINQSINHVLVCICLSVCVSESEYLYLCCISPSLLLSPCVCKLLLLFVGVTPLVTRTSTTESSVHKDWFTAVCLFVSETSLSLCNAMDR